MIFKIVVILLICTCMKFEAVETTINEHQGNSPNNSQKLYLNDDNFEQVTNIMKLSTSESWFIFFDNKDDASDMIRPEIMNLVEKTKLKNVKVGIVDINNSPYSVFRFNLSPRLFSLVYFKIDLSDSLNLWPKLYIYNGPKGFDKMHNFIEKGHLTDSKMIAAVESPISFYECTKRQAKEFINHMTRHFNFIFNMLGLGEDAALQKLISIYTAFSFVMLVLLVSIMKISKFMEGKKKDEDGQEEKKEAKEEQKPEGSRSKAKTE